MGHGSYFAVLPRPAACCGTGMSNLGPLFASSDVFWRLWGDRRCDGRLPLAVPKAKVDILVIFIVFFRYLPRSRMDHA